MLTPGARVWRWDCSDFLTGVGCDVNWGGNKATQAVLAAGHRGLRCYVVTVAKCSPVSGNHLKTARLSGPGPVVACWTANTVLAMVVAPFSRPVAADKRDLQRQQVSNLQGPANVYVKPGVLLSPDRTKLAVQGRIFSADGLKAGDLYPGAEVIVRYATESQCLLSVQQVAQKDQAATGAMMLSPQEQTLLKLISQGLGDKHIARQLNLSPSTVRTYNSALYRKLGVNDRKQAIEKARELRLVDVD